jgi:Ca-activated chloride channel family protein
MRRSRRTFLSITVAMLAAGGVVYSFAVPKDSPLSATSLISPPAVEVTIASSVTKQRWLEDAARSFAEADVRTASGAPIRITVSPVLSGESLLQISEGILTPTVWSPGETAWVDQLNDRWGRSHPTSPTSAGCEPTILTPVGLAMWRPMAEALGWPDQPIGLQTLVDLANDPAGWASKGHPEWGTLKLGHTHPQYSSAGLLFLASVIYSGLGKTSGLTAEDVYAPETTQALVTLAENTAKYGMVTTDLLGKMAEGGPDFLHVAAAFEEGTVRFNVERADELRWPLAFLFPSEGTFWADHPYCILDQSGWVSDDQAEAAGLFLDHLLSPEVQARAESFYLRPLSNGVALGAQLSLENGTDPKASPASIPPFSLPAPQVSEAIIDQFLTTKRKATTLIVLDVSGSMNGERIRTATEATAEFLDSFEPQDRVGLMAFNDTVSTISDIRPMSEVAETLRATVLNLVSGGGTNMNGAICRATETLQATAEADRAAGENRVYGIILLSDGADTSGEISDTRMFNECLRTGAETEGFKVFSISFGNEAPANVLIRIARETNGALFPADPASIRATYNKIAAEQ